MKDICVLIVTYNRKTYLMQLINRLVRLDYKIGRIIIFDNYSQDGTPDYLVDNGVISEWKEAERNCSIFEGTGIVYYRNNNNSGGSGGFHDGMKLAMSYSFDCLWCMDDDVLPDKTCLTELVNTISDDCKMAVPSRNDENYVDRPIIHVNLSNPFRFHRIKTSVSCSEIEGDTVDVVDVAFEGPLISREVISQIGYMNKDLFIFFDDSDYSYRASKVTKIKYCKNAMLHKQIIPNCDNKREYGWRDYYTIRNRMWFDHVNGETVLVKKLRPMLFCAALILKSVAIRKMMNVKVIIKAYCDMKNNNMGKTVDPAKGLLL